MSSLHRPVHKRNLCKFESKMFRKRATIICKRAVIKRVWLTQHLFQVKSSAIFFSYWISSHCIQACSLKLIIIIVFSLLRMLWCKGVGYIKPPVGFSLHLNLLKLFTVDGSPVVKSSRWDKYCWCRWRWRWWAFR